MTTSSASISSLRCVPDVYFTYIFGLLFTQMSVIVLFVILHGGVVFNIIYFVLVLYTTISIVLFSATFNFPLLGSQLMVFMYCFFV